MKWIVDDYEGLLAERIGLLRKRFAGDISARESERLGEIDAMVEMVENAELNAALDRTFGVETEE